MNELEPFDGAVAPMFVSAALEVPTNVDALSPIMRRHVGNVNAFLNMVAKGDGIQGNLNLFHLVKSDQQWLTCLKIPLIQGDQIKSMLVVVQSGAADGQKMRDVFTSPSSTISEIQQACIAIGRISGADIAADQLRIGKVLFLPDRANGLVIRSTNGEKNDFDFEIAIREFGHRVSKMQPRVEDKHDARREDLHPFVPAGDEGISSLSERQDVVLSPDLVVHPRIVEIEGRRIELMRLGYIAKGITSHKASLLGVVDPGGEDDYTPNPVFGWTPAEMKSIRDMWSCVFKEPINFSLGRVTFAEFDDKLVVVLHSHQDQHILCISVPHQGSNSSNRVNSDWRPYMAFSIFASLSEDDGKYMVSAITGAGSQLAVKSVLDTFTHSDLEESFGETPSLDDRLVIQRGTTELVNLLWPEGKRLYGNESLLSSGKRDRVRSVLADILETYPPKKG